MTSTDGSPLDPGYERVLAAETEEEAIKLEIDALSETDKSSRPGDPDPADVEAPAPEVAEAVSQLERVLARAANEIGYREGSNNNTKYGSWYGANNQPWCAMFVSWVFFHEGLPLPATISKGFARTLYGAQWFQSQGRWTKSPSRGHVVFYDLTQSVPSIDHVGIVEGVAPDGSITVIEGNTSPDGSREGVGVFRRGRRSAIVGYGIPAYTNGDGGRDDWRTHPLLRRGAAGPAVRHMQDLLIRAGHHPRGGADGQFGPSSQQEVKAYQASRGLVADGICGPRTWEQLHR